MTTTTYWLDSTADENCQKFDQPLSTQPVFAGNFQGAAANIGRWFTPSCLQGCQKKMLGMILEGVHCCELPSISQILVRDLIVPHLGCKYVESQLTLAQNQPEFRRCPDCNLPPVENSSFDDRNRFRVWNLEEMKFWYVLFVKQSSLLGKFEKMVGVYVSFWWVEIHPFHVEQSRNTIFEYIDTTWRSLIDAIIVNWLDAP